jgi:hypothetical protein
MFGSYVPSTLSNAMKTTNSGRATNISTRRNEQLDDDLFGTLSNVLATKPKTEKQQNNNKNSSSSSSGNPFAQSFTNDDKTRDLKLPPSWPDIDHDSIVDKSPKKSKPSLASATAENANSLSHLNVKNDDEQANDADIKNLNRNLISPLTFKTQQTFASSIDQDRQKRATTSLNATNVEGDDNDDEDAWLETLFSSKRPPVNSVSQLKLNQKRGYI